MDKHIALLRPLCQFSAEKDHYSICIRGETRTGQSFLNIIYNHPPVILNVRVVFLKHRTSNPFLQTQTNVGRLLILDSQETRFKE